ncbi:MAG: aminotransferase class I/II-fold pyridoxal phosphate-dependent enzyme [Saprospiraceae bacterium]|nr:aminotransferase class I/II-fold pyridoxal phosphate-dependent enzyme [Saprospiraceae bacterium]
MNKVIGDKTFISLRDKYFNLRNKNVYGELSFRERINAARDVKQIAMQNDYFLYRREQDSFSISDVNNKNGSPSCKVNLASNDYLDFTHHPQIIKVGVQYIEKLGVGSGSVPMLSGTYKIHNELEANLAAFTGYDSSLVFNSGYTANYGLLTSLLTFKDVAILDTRVHASIIDGCVNTNCIYFSHNDCHSLQIAIQKAKVYRNKLIIVDGVYSMGGEIAPLCEIIEIGKNNNAMIMVDESHSIGVMGENGKGTQSYLKIIEKVDISTGSLGKALGGIGGYVTGPSGLINLLELTCRSYIYSTSIPPANAATINKALDLLESGDENISKLWSNIHFFKESLKSMGHNTGNSNSAIIPILISDDEKLMGLTQKLYKKGILVNAIFYPVVPKRQSLIRISMSAGIEKTKLEYVLNQIESDSKTLGLIKSAPKKMKAL